MNNYARKISMYLPYVALFTALLYMSLGDQLKTIYWLGFAIFLKIK